MKKYLAAVTLAAVALAAALAQPASAIKFPSLTTIYVGSGVRDTGGLSNTGTATAFHCTNVSGIATSVRILVLTGGGDVAASSTLTVAHGVTISVSTRETFLYNDVALGTGVVSEGAVNIESLQSAVFCNAKTINAAAAFPEGVTLPLVRVNPHPGTVE